MEGTVLRIEQGSLHDGAGLRTVVYLKGCPLRCAWCSIPESQSKQIEKGFGQTMTAEEVMDEIEKEAVFYFHSDGGVTISGGEALVQADFAKEILQKSKYIGINTVLETSFCGAYNEIQKVAPYVDTLFVDVKMFTSKLHKQWTGLDNQQILKNIRRFLIEYPNCEVRIRVPVVPGINMNLTELLTIACFVADLDRFVPLELLPYHCYGMHGYQALGLEYPLADTPAPSPKEMFALADQLARTVPHLLVTALTKTFIYLLNPSFILWINERHSLAAASSRIELLLKSVSVFLRCFFEVNLSNEHWLNRYIFTVCRLSCDRCYDF
ncbi:radical SAM protein [Enterococcus faecium]|nr:radical SAM protein [Enterococcus faecium]